MSLKLNVNCRLIGDKIVWIKDNGDAVTYQFGAKPMYYGYPRPDIMTFFPSPRNIFEVVSPEKVKAWLDSKKRETHVWGDGFLYNLPRKMQYVYHPTIQDMDDGLPYFWEGLIKLGWAFQKPIPKLIEMINNFEHKR